MIVVTGLSGVGKTTILKKSGLKNVVELDAIVKDVLYKRKSRLYWDIRDAFGKKYVKFNKVNTTKLGQLVFNDEESLNKLNELVKPYIKTYLSVLKVQNENYIVDMAIYMNQEKEYKEFFDKVIVIDRPVHNNGKFEYLDEFKQPIKRNKIEYDYLINDESIDEAVKNLKSFIK